ncbi:UNVERIFIED_CONTAM: hypothetical protein Slati_1787300 [Sesamum latifolium]|uniref:Uncharacterized protein n=1 Tax=Sesamum latifolium TaxID=2727402 RepID=A0AAW2X041_9LAMI
MPATQCGYLRMAPQDLEGIDPQVITHHLNIDPNCKPVKQKKRHFGPEKDKIIQAEVNKLMAAGHIEEIQFPEWLSNVVLVPKPGGKWRMDTSDHARPRRSKKVSFITSEGTFCYVAMPFGLKNAGATYQRLVDKIFPSNRQKCGSSPASKALARGYPVPILVSHPQVVSSVLVREEGGKQLPIYYVSKVLNGAEGRYTPLRRWRWHWWLPPEGFGHTSIYRGQDQHSIETNLGKARYLRATGEMGGAK